MGILPAERTHPLSSVWSRGLQSHQWRSDLCRLGWFKPWAKTCSMQLDFKFWTARFMLEAVASVIVHVLRGRKEQRLEQKSFSSFVNCLVKCEVKVTQSCPTLWSHGIVHRILQARILEWVAFPFSRGSSQPRDRTICQIQSVACLWTTVS